MTAFRAFFRNWGAKLLSLVLAWGIWYAVREDLEDERQATVPVIAEAPPGSDLDGVVLTSRVAVTIKGPRREVDEMASGSHPLVAPLTADDLASDELSKFRDFRAEDLHVASPLRPGVVRIVEMEPRLVRVQVRRLESRTVPLSPPDFPGANDVHVGVVIKRRSEEALVRGPVEHLRSILELKTAVARDAFRRAVESMGDSGHTTVTLPLTVDASQKSFVTLLEPREPEVTVDLVRLQDKEVEVPLSIFRDRGPGSADGPARRLQFAEINRPCLVSRHPPRVLFKLRGSPKSLAAVRAETLRAFVLEEELSPELAFGDLRVHMSDLPQGVTLDREDYFVSVETVH